MTLEDTVRDMARGIGFDRVAITSADPAEEDGLRLAEWVRSGRHAGMGWMGRDPARRASPRGIQSEARSVVVVAASHHAGPVPPAPGRAFGRVARYAWGADYHTAVAARMESFRKDLARRFGPSFLAEFTVDAQPLMERALGRRSGLGFVGKNTCLIAPGAGSTLFLAALMINRDLSPDPERPLHCGHCARCRTACPTGALNTPYVLDARLCVAYHTIENRGSIPRDLRTVTGDWLLGCDDCQEVCPHNAHPLEGRWPELSPHRGPGAWVSLKEVLTVVDEAAFRRRWAGTSLLRAKRNGLARNACLVAAHREAQEELKEELTAALREDPSPLVRGHAAWALGRTTWAQPRLEAALTTETDPSVREEIGAALGRFGVSHGAPATPSPDIADACAGPPVEREDQTPHTLLGRQP